MPHPTIARIIAAIADTGEWSVEDHAMAEISESSVADIEDAMRWIMEAETDRETAGEWLAWAQDASIAIQTTLAMVLASAPGTPDDPE